MGAAIPIQQIPRQPGAYPATPLPDEFGNRRRDVFFGQLNFPNVPAAGGAAVVLALPVDTDADIFVTGGTQFVTTVADLTTRLPVPAIFATLRRTSASRDLSNAAVPLPSLFGSGERPARWETGLLIRAGSTLQVTLISNHGAATAANLTFWGTKLFL
jgi:hypothetical protein